MAEMTQVEGAPRAQGLLSRIVGVVVSPRETFLGIAAHPKVLGGLAIVLLVGSLPVGAFLFTDVGQQAWLDQQVTQSEAWGRPVSDEQYAQMEKMAPFVGYFGTVFVLIFFILLILIVSGVLYAVFNAAMGGRATFKQLFAVVTHSCVILVLGTIIGVPLNYARESISSAFNLAALAPGLDESSFLGGLLGTIDLFWVWVTVVLGIGLAVLYRRRTQPILIALFAVYAVIGVIIAAVKSAMGGS